MNTGSFEFSDEEIREALLEQGYDYFSPGAFGSLKQELRNIAGSASSSKTNSEQTSDIVNKADTVSLASVSPLDGDELDSANNCNDDSFLLRAATEPICENSNYCSHGGLCLNCSGETFKTSLQTSSHQIFLQNCPKKASGVPGPTQQLLVGQTSSGEDADIDDADGGDVCLPEQLAQTRKLISDARGYLNKLNRWKLDVDWENAAAPLKHLCEHPMVVKLARPDTIAEAAMEIRKDIQDAGLTTQDAHIPFVDFANYVRSLERAKKDASMPPHPVRAVVNPEPGGLAFKHDPVSRYAEYRAGWEKRPVPGEAAHKDLRWKVREYMMQRDVPRAAVTAGSVRLA